VTVLFIRTLSYLWMYIRRCLLFLQFCCQYSKDVGDSVQIPISVLYAVIDAIQAQSQVMIFASSVFHFLYRRNAGPVAGYDLRFERFSFSLYIAPVWPAQRFQRIFVKYSRAFTIMHAPWAALQCDMRLFHSPVPALDG